MGRTFHRLQKALCEFRLLYPEASIRTLQVFLAVADNPGIKTQDLVHLIKPTSSSSSVSRQLMLLSDMTWQGNKPGLDLVVAEVDAEDRRTKRMVLTRRGRTLEASLRNAIGDQ